MILILLYNSYFFASLVKGTSTTTNPSDAPPSTQVYFLAQNLPADNSPLINENTTPVFKVKLAQLKKEVIESPTQYFVLKSYIQHNQLHFNIPIICFKFPVSQHTSDG
jgi:hypothetical protein